MRMHASLLLLALGTAACSGDTGPMGPAGNANVTSGTFTVAPSQYSNGFWFFSVDGGNQGNPARIATIAVPELTEALVANGAVLVYLRVPAASTQPASQWSLLPFHQGGFGGGYLVSIKAAVDVGTIRIGYAHESTSGAAAPDVYQVPLPTYEFKWVAIAGMAPPVLASLASLGPDAIVGPGGG